MSLTHNLFRRFQIQNYSKFLLRRCISSSARCLSSCSGGNGENIKEALFIPYQCEEPRRLRKISIFGAGGRVGIATAFYLYVRDFVDELVFCDAKNMDKKVLGEALDMTHCGCLNHHPKVTVSMDYKKSCDSDIILLACGVPRKQGQTRLDVAQTNIDIYKQIVPKAVKLSPEAVILVESNPVDIMCFAAWKYSEFPKHRIVGAGSELDSSRFRFLIAKRLGINPKSLYGWVLGEHGDSSVPNWSGVNVAGTKLREIDEKVGAKCGDENNWNSVFEEAKGSGAYLNGIKGFTSWGIALATSNIAYAIIKDTHTIHGCSIMAKGFHGIDVEVFVSLPTVLSNRGAYAIVNQELCGRELELFQKSACTLYNNMKTLKF